MIASNAQQKVTSIKELERIIVDVQECWVNTAYKLIPFYRGEASNTFFLQPKLCREQQDFESIKKHERIIFANFKKAVDNKQIQVSVNFFAEKYPEANNWELLFHGQHLGLKTRLLDWSNIWELALQFALLNKDNEAICKEHDSQFWIFLCPEEHMIYNGKYETMYQHKPFEINDWYLINPPILMDINNKETIGSRRMSRQQGRFLVLPTERLKEPVEIQNDINKFIYKCIIPKENKKEMIKELNERIQEPKWFYYESDIEYNKIISEINDSTLVDL